MSGDKNNGIDWQSELRARLEAYEKRTGRRISGNRESEDASSREVRDSRAPEEKEIRGSREPDGMKEAAEVNPPGTILFDDEDEELDYPAGPDFLAVLDGADVEEDEDSFLFRERLSRDTDPEEDAGEMLDSDLTIGNYDKEEDASYFEDFDEGPDEGKVVAEPVVKVVNIEEFRMDSSAEEVFIPLKSESSRDRVRELEPEEEEEDVPKEIIVSRLLAGTIDMVLAVITAAGFMEIAAWKLSLNFFEVGVLKWIGILAVFFYIFSCLYFLTLIQRTPGMLLTELKLNPGRGGRLTFLPVLIRTLVFFPSALSVTGLVWSFFDNRARCLHDILSGTRVISTRSF